MNYFLKIPPQNIRNTICDYLEQNKPIMEGIETNQVIKMEGVNNYINNMRNSSTWGGAIEIQAACNIWNMKVIVINIRNRVKGNNEIEFIPLHGKINNTIKITWSGGHYEPIRA
tara:strand:- start:388 stop:729 length:342 start_codon:yes stop_codon:yes gene_type:complete